MGAEERQCAGEGRQIAGKLLEEEAFGPLPQIGGEIVDKSQLLVLRIQRFASAE